MLIARIRAKIKKNHQRKERNFPIGSSSSNPLVECFLFGIFKLWLLFVNFWFCSIIEIDFAFSISWCSVVFTIESGRGGAGTSGIGNGTTVVIPLRGVGGGVTWTFFGGNGGVTDICRSKLIVTSATDFSSVDFCLFSSCWFNSSFELTAAALSSVMLGNFNGVFSSRYWSSYI